MRNRAAVAAMLLLMFSDVGHAVLVPLDDYSITIASRRFEIVDWTSTLSWPPNDPPISYTTLYFGPLGGLNVPFTARQGAAGLGLGLLLAVAAVILVIRRLLRRGA